MLDVRCASLTGIGVLTRDCERISREEESGISEVLLQYLDRLIAPAGRTDRRTNMAIYWERIRSQVNHPHIAHQ